MMIRSMLLMVYLLGTLFGCGNGNVASKGAFIDISGNQNETAISDLSTSPLPQPKLNCSEFLPSDSTAMNEIVCAKGIFLEVAGIGGESTGKAIANRSGLHEIDLTPYQLDRYFVDGKRATLMGKLQYYEGVETGSRKVFVVTKVISVTAPISISLP